MAYESRRGRVNLAQENFVSGNETRTSIFPSAPPSTWKAPDYDYSAAIPSPASGTVNCKEGDSMDSVLNCVRGMAYYTDVIGFGESGNPLTKGMDYQHLGVRYFMPTSQTCPNGAKMWKYVDGIPKGDALGKGVQNALKEMNLPQLRGLAPGMMEDTKTGLDPRPVVNAVLGSPYPACQAVTLPVGDERGNLRDPRDPENVWIPAETVQYNGSQPVQTRWVQATDSRGNPIYLDQKQWKCTPKLLDDNGNPLDKPKPIPAECKQGFQDFRQRTNLAVAVFLGALVVYYFQEKK